MIRILFFLLCKSLDMETNSFTWLKLHSLTYNLKLNKWPHIRPLFLMRGVRQSCRLSMLLYIIETAVVPISLINVKGIQIRDQEIKKINFVYVTTIFLRDITCLNRIQLTLKLYEDASSSKINHASWAGA